MTTSPSVGETAIRILQAFIAGGAQPGKMLAPSLLQGMVHIKDIPDFQAALGYASEHGWVEKLSNNEYRLTDAGFAAAHSAT